MGLLQSYTSFIINHPAKIIIANITFVALLFILTTYIKPWPSFSDPRIGLEARDTLISNRLNSWRLLVDEIQASHNNLSLDANSPDYLMTYVHDQQVNLNPTHLSNELNNSLADDFEGNYPNEPPIVEMSTDHLNNKNNNSSNDQLDEDEGEYYRNVKLAADNQATLMHYSTDSKAAFCGQLFEGYAHVVVSPTSKQASLGLLNLHSIISMCQLDHKLRLELDPEHKIIFQNECERFQINSSLHLQAHEPTKQETSACCNSWSLPNYIACLSNHSSCFNLESKDIKNFENLLYLCTPYYNRAPHEECFTNQKEATKDLGGPNFNLLNSPAHETITQPHCGYIPEKCLRCGGWIYYVMHYLVNHNLMQSKNDSNVSKPINRHDRYTFSPKNDIAFNKLTYSNIFLPIAKSPSLMKYYQALSRYSLKTPYVNVKAMDLGLKNVLFEHLLSEDAKLFLIVLIAIFMVITIHTWSLVISSVIMLIICLSLCMSFIIYELILGIPIFPFMNLLAVVISFGICSDNAMLFCKHWPADDDPEITTNAAVREPIVESSDNTEDCVVRNKSSYNINPTDNEQNALDRTFKRAILGTFIATLATACSFVISAISKVTAVRCFCIFATLSVITNYLLIVLLIPPALIIDLRLSIVFCQIASFGPTYSNCLIRLQHIRNKMIEIGKIFNRTILDFIKDYRYYLMITFITLLSCSSILVFYRPTLQPTEDDQIQLLATKHPFEQYNRHVKNHFGFERHRDAGSGDTLPVRVVFGVLPTDNGDLFDSHHRGNLVFEHKFDLADPKAQVWMVDFCKKLKQQRFIKPSDSPELSNCFMETFKSWMEERPCKDPVTDIDRSPCCAAYEFPFPRPVFNKCIGEVVKAIRKTPQKETNLNAGVRFFKNSTKVAAIVIEYQSFFNLTGSFRKMDRFFNALDEWVTWQINNTAPSSLKSGWFISSNLDWLSLQVELLDSTTTSIILEVVFAMIALFLSTRDLVITLVGSLTIGTIITMTVAALILLKWTLGVAESIMISLTIGLSIDFALHYSVAFNELKKNGSNDAIIHGVLNQVGGPIALATATTSMAGFVIIWSEILAYQELGVFLILIAIISWLNSTFFLLPMLASVDQLMLHSINRLDTKRLIGNMIKRINDKFWTPQ